MDNVTIISDPSKLTTEQLLREINHSNTLHTQRMDLMQKAMDSAHEDLVRVPTDVQKAVKVLKDLHELAFVNMLKTLHDSKDLVLTKIEDEHRLKEERFSKVEQRFLNFEDTRKEQKQDTNISIDRALASAKEGVIEQNKSNMAAIAKSESSTQKQIDQLADHGSSMQAAMDSKLADIKERMTRLETVSTAAGMPDLSRRVATNEMAINSMAGQRTGRKEFWGYIIGAIGLITTILTIIFVIVRK